MTLEERAISLGITLATMFWRARNGWSSWEAISITKEQAKRRIALANTHYFVNDTPVKDLVKPENYGCTIRRIQKGMHPREAVRLQDCRFRNNMGEFYEKSKKAVSRIRARQRVYSGWPIELACNTPLIKSRWEREAFQKRGIK